MKIISNLDDAFSVIFELESRPVEGQQLQHKDQRKGEKKERPQKSLKTWSLFLSKNKFLFLYVHAELGQVFYMTCKQNITSDYNPLVKMK